MTATTHDQLSAAAREAGYELDASPSTEMSNETWWRHQGTFELVREETLFERLGHERHRR